jgi:hypothetical protein
VKTVPVEAATVVLFVASMYLAAGLIVGIAFVTRGVGRIDTSAQDAPWSFRVMILPGAAALWPLVLRKWIRAARGRPS